MYSYNINSGGGYGNNAWGGDTVSYDTIPGAPTAAATNAANLLYTRGGTQTDPVYPAATRLLDPNDPLAAHDVAMHGAEHAVGGGTVGSGVAGQYTGRLRQYDIERRAALGNQLLTGAYGRVPTPADPNAKAALDLKRYEGDADRANAVLLAQISGRYGGGGGYRGGGAAAPAGTPWSGGQGVAVGQGGIKSTLAGQYGGPQLGVGYGIGGPGVNLVNRTSQFTDDERNVADTQNMDEFFWGDES